MPRPPDNCCRFPDCGRPLPQEDARDKLTIRTDICQRCAEVVLATSPGRKAYIADHYARLRVLEEDSPVASTTRQVEDAGPLGTIRSKKARRRKRQKLVTARIRRPQEDLLIRRERSEEIDRMVREVLARCAERRRRQES